MTSRVDLPLSKAQQQELDRLLKREAELMMRRSEARDRIAATKAKIAAFAVDNEIRREIHKNLCYHANKVGYIQEEMIDAERMETMMAWNRLFLLEDQLYWLKADAKKAAAEAAAEKAVSAWNLLHYQQKQKKKKTFFLVANFI